VCLASLCVKAIFDMIHHFSSLFITSMTDIEDLRQIARVARGAGRAKTSGIRGGACHRRPPACATSIFQSESEPEIDIYFQRGMSLKVGFVSSAR